MLKGILKAATLGGIIATALMIAAPAHAGTKTPATRAAKISKVSIAPLPSPYPDPTWKTASMSATTRGSTISIAPLPSPFPNPDVYPDPDKKAGFDVGPVGKVGFDPGPVGFDVGPVGANNANGMVSIAPLPSP